MEYYGTLLDTIKHYRPFLGIKFHIRVPKNFDLLLRCKQSLLFHFKNPFISNCFQNSNQNSKFYKNAPSPLITKSSTTSFTFYFISRTFFCRAFLLKAIIRQPNSSSFIPLLILLMFLLPRCDIERKLFTQSIAPRL